MAKRETDRVLEQLLRAVNESGQAQVPITVSVHGTTVAGLLIGEQAYFAELAEGSPLLSALQPASGLLGKEYAKEVEADFGHHVHIRAAGAEKGLWRISLESIDAWAAGAAPAGDEDKGPFARLLGV